MHPPSPGTSDPPVAVVTGGSKGIGRAIALELARAGFAVAIVARGRDALDTTGQELEALGAVCLTISADLTDEGTAPEVIARVIDEFGRIDAIINNVAISSRSRALHLATLDDFESVFRTNVWVPLRICQAALPELKASGRGVIINIASNEGVRPSAGLGVYPASKAALLNLTTQMAKEWGIDGVRTVGIAPGLVRTELAAPLVSAVEKSGIKLNPVGRVGEPEDIARIVALCATEAGSYISATTLVIDGGELTCGPFG